MIILASICFFIVAIERILIWTALWQQSEYRKDRFFSPLTSGKKIFFSFSSILFLATLSYGFVIFNDSLTQLYYIGITCLLIISSIIFFYKLIRSSFAYPNITPHSLGICLGSIFILAVSFEIPLVDQYLWFVVLLFLVPLIVTFFIALFSFPSEILTDIRVQQAGRRLQKYKNIQVIVISGSQKKAIVHKYIVGVLSTVFSVVSTTFYSNTPMNIANTILKKVNENTDFLVVEIGMYKKEEIAKLSNMLRPDIAIISDWDDNELRFYRNKNNFIQAKTEILHGLSKNGIIILKGDDNLIYELSKKTKKKKIFYKVNTSRRYASVVASNINVKKNGVESAIKIRNKHYTFFATHVSPEMVQYMLPAVFLADMYAIPFKKIKRSIFSLRLRA